MNPEGGRNGKKKDDWFADYPSALAKKVVYRKKEDSTREKEREKRRTSEKKHGAGKPGSAAWGKGKDPTMERGKKNSPRGKGNPGNLRNLRGGGYRGEKAPSKKGGNCSRTRRIYKKEDSKKKKKTPISERSP